MRRGFNGISSWIDDQPRSKQLVHHIPLSDPLVRKFIGKRQGEVDSLNLNMAFRGPGLLRLWVCHEFSSISSVTLPFLLEKWKAQTFFSTMDDGL